MQKFWENPLGKEIKRELRERSLLQTSQAESWRILREKRLVKSGKKGEKRTNKTLNKRLLRNSSWFFHLLFYFFLFSSLNLSTIDLMPGSFTASYNFVFTSLLSFEISCLVWFMALKFKLRTWSIFILYLSVDSIDRISSLFF